MGALRQEAQQALDRVMLAIDIIEHDHPFMRTDTYILRGIALGLTAMTMWMLVLALRPDHVWLHWFAAGSNALAAVWLIAKNEYRWHRWCNTRRQAWATAHYLRALITTRST